MNVVSDSVSGYCCSLTTDCRLLFKKRIEILDTYVRPEIIPGRCLVTIAEKTSSGFLLETALLGANHFIAERAICASNARAAR